MWYLSHMSCNFHLVAKNVSLPPTTFYFSVTPVIETKVKMQKKYKQRLSVLLFYNDGLSHAMSRRVLNQTYYYLRNEQGGISLDMYHAVGENTFSNMIPYLTGTYYLPYKLRIYKA